MDKVETLRWMHGTLASIKLGTHTDGSVGICTKVAVAWTQSHGKYTESDAARIMRGLCARWPAGTGDKYYPIPANEDMHVADDAWLQDYVDEMHGDVTKGRAMYQFEMHANKWEGQQLAYRMAFLDWCLVNIESQIAELEHAQ